MRLPPAALFGGRDGLFVHQPPEHLAKVPNFTAEVTLDCLHALRTVNLETPMSDQVIEDGNLVIVEIGLGELGRWLPGPLGFHHRFHGVSPSFG